MKTTIITAQIAIALIVAPAFAANEDFTYLALGDSVAFGLNPLLLPPYSSKLPKAEDFIGYPEVLAAIVNLAEKEVNASCPGETSGSFLNVNSPDYGCNSAHIQPGAPTIPPFKTSIGLHTPYKIAQMDFAERQFRTNKHINLVTMSIGANDVLLVLPKLAVCGPPTTPAAIGCGHAVLDPVLQSYAANLGEILMRVRADYEGTLILVKYYSPTPALDGIAVALNSVMAAVGAHFGVKFADGFTAFQLASAHFHTNDACQAGLVIPLPASPPAPPCDIHPTKLGREILAATVLANFVGIEHGDGNHSEQDNQHDDH